MEPKTQPKISRNGTTHSTALLATRQRSRIGALLATRATDESPDIVQKRIS